MDLRVDHVTVAGRTLDRLEAAFSGAGMEPTYGGTHSNGVTHMSTVAFPDGTYLELVSTLEEGADSPWWDSHVRSDAGPCAWAIRVEDATAVAERLRDRGVAVEGPVPYARERPDGVRVAWELVFLGDGEPGSLLPFCIADTTPRGRRVGDAVPDTGLTGVETVVLGVANAADALERLGRAFGVEATGSVESERLGARVTRTDAPVALAEPTSDGWLHDRVATLGTAPCAFLFGADGGEFPTTTESWAGTRVRWLDPDRLGGYRHLGVVEG